LYPNEFPSSFRISKLGYREETIVFKNPNDSLLISLTPLEIHKEKFIYKSPDEYGILLKKALGKFQKYEGSEYPDPSQKKLVYCRITTSVDSTINRIFESYAHINVNKYAIQQAPSDVARYGATNANIPGLSENTLDFKMYPFLNLPMFIERYITKRGFFEQNGARIALVEISLPDTKNVYYINVADTSIIYFTNHSITGSRKKIQVSDTEWQFNRNNSTEVSFSRSVYSRNNYLLDWVAMKEDFRLKQKNKTDQFISKSTLFAVIPESSLINSAVKDLVNQETLTPVKQQINFNAKVSLSAKSTIFNSETNELLLKPYKHDFWVQNSYVTPDPIEQKHIQKWENDNLFYSEDRLSHANETNEFDSLVNVINNNIVAVEKVYIETDRTNYLSGDTIWFSAFILESLNMDSTSLSRILHVDLINADNKLEKHLKLIIRNGRSSGNFTLQKELKNGIFRLRAYTQYMRNFQSEYIFEKDIPVRQSNFNKFIIVNPVINGDVKGDSVGLYLKTVLPDEYKNETKQLEVFVKLNDTLSVKKLFKFQNDLNRSMVFFVPASLACSILDLRLTLSAKEVISEQQISLKLKSGISLQFFPESGKMIAGVQTIIAYKATDNESNPTGFDAEIVDENQNEVLHLKGNKSGVGKFTFTPRANHTYKAFVTLYGSKYFFNMPVTEPKGYILNFNSDSNIICIKNNQNINKSKHYLLVSVRGAVYTSIEIKLDTTTYRKLLPFESYPKGIVQITLFDSLYHPLAERLAFNNRPDQKMLIQVETDKEVYRQREKVNLTISVTDTDGNPIESSLTMAVVDASKTDSLSNSASIETSIYLASELKGEINYKLFNLSDTTSLGNREIDLVMMTQGWRNFLWNSIRYTNKMTELYPIEKGFSVNGTVFNYKKGRSGSDYKLNFIDLKTSYNTIVNIDENNRFKIDIPFFYGDHFLFIQNRNKKDKVDNLDLTLDTVPVPVISYRYNELPYISYKSGYIKTINEKFTKIESINESFDNTINIPEVTIRGKYHPWDTEADITVNLDKKDPTGEKYTSLFQMIYEEFGEKAFTAVGYGTYKRSFPPILIVNGAHLTEESCPPCYDFEAYKWATIIPVNEISNVKFFEAGGEYSRFVTPPPPSVMDAIMPDIVLNFPGHNRLLTESLVSNRIFPSVVSFTTYSNSYRGNPNGTIVFPFQGIYQEREFYKPDYENNLSLIPDNRTTIYWNPEIKTDSSGKANISFYNSDLKGKAMIRVSGIGYYKNDVASTTSDYLSH